MEITDDKGNKVSTSSVHVFNETADKIHAERNRLRRVEVSGKKPSAAVVVQRMWEAYEQSINASTAKEFSQPSPSNGSVINFTDPLHATLDRLLSAGEREPVEALFRWASAYLASEELQTLLLAEGKGLRERAKDLLGRVLGTPNRGEGNQPDVRPGDAGHDSEDRKKAS